MSSANHMTPTEDQRAIAAFLRGLAEHAERDARFASVVRHLLLESGLLATADLDEGNRARKRKRPASGGAAPEAATVDPFPVLREGGEAALRARLDTLDLVALRQIVRAHRLDPARISARWTARERVVSLIVEQTRARANHGKAFTRV